MLAIWTCSPTLWIQTSCSCSPDQIWRGALERKTHTHKHMCLEEVGCGETGEVSTQMLGLWYCYVLSTWSQNSPIYYTFQKHGSALIRSDCIPKEIFNLILKQKEQLFCCVLKSPCTLFNTFPSTICLHSASQHPLFIIQSIPNAQNKIFSLNSQFPSQKKFDCRSGLQPLDNLVLAH